jgi:hypothetical protein
MYYSDLGHLYIGLLILAYAGHCPLSTTGVFILSRLVVSQLVEAYGHPERLAGWSWLKINFI